MSVIDNQLIQNVQKFWEKHTYLGQCVFLDLETTGLSPLHHEIVEIGAIKIDNKGKISTFQTLIKPMRPITPFNESIHGISNEMIKNAPNISKVFDDFLTFIEGSSLFGHNVKFDCGFIISNAKILSKNLNFHNVFDTCLLSRFVTKTTKKLPMSHKLGNLAKFYKINNPFYHRALNDSLMTLELLIKLIEELCAIDFSLDEIIKILNDKSFVFKLGFDLNNIKVQGIGMSEQDYVVLSKNTMNQSPLYIRYEKGTFGQSPRPIRPIAILPLHEGIVLNAECLITNQIKNFKMKYITSVTEKEY